MGYKCPNCHMDFGFDRNALNEHLENNVHCKVEAEVTLQLLPIALGIKKAKYPYGDRGREEPLNKRVIDEVSPNHVWVKENAITNPDGSDNMICKRCGLKAKRFYSSMKYDMRYTKKIQHCID